MGSAECPKMCCLLQRMLASVLWIIVSSYFVLPIIALPAEETFIFQADFPKNQFEHFLRRDALIEAEKEFENRNWNLSKVEKIADQYLAYLKWREFRNTVNLNFPPSKPIERVLDDIVKSELYQVLRDLPKGGILHSHEDHQLSKRTLFDIVWESEDFDNLYIIVSNSSRHVWKMDFFVNPPTDEPWIKVKDSGLTKEDILRQNTLIGLLTPYASDNPTDSSLRWKLINPLWGRASVQLISNINIKRKYILAMYDHCMSEGVSYVESRRSFGLDLPIYTLDFSGESNLTNGKLFLDLDYELEINMAIDAAKQYSVQHPGFIGHKRISYASRSTDRSMFQSVQNTTLRLHKKYPHHILGFDAVGEEDAGHSSLYYLDNYLSLYRDGESSMPLYLHTAETSWPEDLMTSNFQDDLVSTLENAYESLILLAKRVGHGKGFVKKPFLKKILRDRKIAVEVCIVSNQILGMDADMRNHYGQILYKEGIPIVLSPDDPGTFGYDNVTVDWYSAYLGWGLNLGDLKQIALNSLNYSGMTHSEKEIAIGSKWLPSWNEYVMKVKLAACSRDFNREASLEDRLPSFSRLMPGFGSTGTKVHIFGRNFEIAICKMAKCRFGETFVVEAEYESNQHFSCLAPPCVGCAMNATLQVYVSLDGRSFQYTGFYFLYMDSKYLVSGEL